MSDIGLAEALTSDDRVKRPTCAAVIVTYNSARHLPRLLSDLAATAPPVELQVVVVDNESADDSADIAEATGADVLRSGSNLGYAGALNAAWAHVGPGVPILVLNPDLSVHPGAVAALLAAAGQPGVGVAVPTVVDESGAVYPSLRNEPSVLRALVDAVLGRRAGRLPTALSEMVWSPDAYRATQQPDWATGAALMISPKCAAAVGEWDERYFLYSEETDFFRRVREAGFVTRFVPAAVVEHEGGGSGSSSALTALMAVNRVRYFEKYHGRAKGSAFRIVVALHALLRSRDPGQRAALRAVIRRSQWRHLPARPTAGSR
jgi:N-acetylglucosaminyl-diphospho-decaprenol L-rhamnosyltransferase